MGEQNMTDVDIDAIIAEVRRFGREEADFCEWDMAESLADEVERLRAENKELRATNRRLAQQQLADIIKGVYPAGQTRGQ